MFVRFVFVRADAPAEREGAGAEAALAGRAVRRRDAPAAAGRRRGARHRMAAAHMEDSGQSVSGS